MHNNDGVRVPVCRDWAKEIPRQPDGDAFLLHCTGGFRAIEREKGLWHIEPVFDNGAPSAKGFMSKATLRLFLSQNRFTPIAFQRMGWCRGDYHSGWSPITAGRSNPFQGPADLWGSIASNLSRDRTTSDLGRMTAPNHEEIAALLDNRGEVERLARSISLSLRNMDISVEQIAEFYNEQLANLMAGGNLNGERSSTDLDQTLFAHVHAFFMHLGAARDYLGSLAVLRIGKDPHKFDSFAKLLEVVRSDDVEQDGLLRLLLTKGYIEPKPSSANKLIAAGWLKAATDLRNEFMHRRPYGDRFAEYMGYAQPVDEEAGLYRYVRPIITADGEGDVLEVIAGHYRKVVELFQDASVEAAYDSSILTITDADITAANIKS